MGFISDVGRMLSGQGPSTMDPNLIEKKPFQDPYLEQNKRLLESQRLAGERAGAQGLAGQTLAGTQQQELISQMQKRAKGEVPSLAEMQMMKGMDTARQALASQAASSRGISGGLAGRQLARATAGTMGEQAAQGAMLRAAEQQAAEQGLAGMLQSTRAQDQALMAQANQLAQNYMAMGMSADQAQFQANMELEKLRQQARAQQAQVGSQQQAALLGGLATMGASFLTPKKIDPSLKQGTF